MPKIMYTVLVHATYVYCHVGEQADYCYTVVVMVFFTSSLLA